MTIPKPLTIALGVLLLAFGLGAGCLGASDPSEPEAPADATSETVYTCSMHPQIRQGEPGSCPICGMDLIPAVAEGSHNSTELVVLSDRARALAKLRTTVVRRQSDASAQVRLLGSVEAAETTRRNVTTWIGGRGTDMPMPTSGQKWRSCT